MDPREMLVRARSHGRDGLKGGRMGFPLRHPKYGSVDLAQYETAQQMPSNASDVASSRLSDAGQSVTHVSGQTAKLSHATTPSWRSRSFPPHLMARSRKLRMPSVAEDDVACMKTRSAEDGASPEVARRRPPLPAEARWTRVYRPPRSEVQRLNDVDSEIQEANAMLVESFLNVKRRMSFDPDADEMQGAPSCSWAASAPPPDDNTICSQGNSQDDGGRGRRQLGATVLDV